MDIYEYKHRYARTVRAILPCGLTVFAVEQPTSSLTVELRYAVGSLDDDLQVLGISHLIEHLIFEGPARGGVHPLLRDLVLDGAESDAYTGYGDTGYYLNGTVGEIRPMLKAIFAIGFGSTFSRSSLEAEREIVLQEAVQSAASDEFGLWIRRQLCPTLSAVGYRPAGSPESIRNIRLEDVEAHYFRHYRPENAALVLSGGIAAESAIDEVLKHIPNFGGFEAMPRRIRPRLVPQPSKAIHQSADMSDRQLWIFPQPADAAQEVRTGVALSVLCGSEFSMLITDLRREKHIAYEASYALDPVPIPMFAVTIPSSRENFAKVEDALWNQIARISAGDIDPDAFRWVVNRRRRFFNESREEKRPFIAGLFDGWLLGDGVHDLDTQSEVLSMKPDQLASATLGYLNPDVSAKIIHHQGW